MANEMCVYEISKAPYLAVGSVHKIKKDKCYVETSKGKIKKVKPIYIGPFDATKLCMFGVLTSRFFEKDTSFAVDTVKNLSYKLFGVDSNVACTV